MINLGTNNRAGLHVKCEKLEFCENFLFPCIEQRRLCLSICRDTVQYHSGLLGPLSQIEYP